MFARHVLLLIGCSWSGTNSIPSGDGQSRKSPCDTSRRGYFFSSPAGWRRSAADVAADHVAEQIPLVALELHQLKLRDRSEIGSAGVDFNARQQTAELKILDARRLLHNVFSCEIVTTGLQHMHEPLRDGIAVHY